MQKIILEAEGVNLRGMLNESLAAKEFLKRLPFSISLKKYENAFCGTAANGIFEPYDLQKGCKNGDIILWNHCFVINTGDEEHSEDYGLTMVIGHIDEYEQLIELPETIRLIIRVEK